ncbi:uncharacterized protein LOC125460438 isoform X2 [Stegostoma tigrinum]|nr:uncharacterized protein LOC125460438 isoform X2 [Stegostoma tigrinum]XP_048403902.1 uncharacterized protein LOC125460438 isoform X2 [Stegostoma tigrinum]XP_048403903.1 uncharacterized protein LOC125460438 isoform X2 [Stegostoma tigrinum]XP_048403904.1 uncharacterized protein LOC125460438 isoform X2 [Stegostoma tigrinum]XP_048403905.1 uncharacterized protein LOC125460438 isoform X2 [Stegostoma tigrinum]XP_048403906.1 uncharacterized protein LOC125460438 isoform X2 [Stegostoma tigrinum]XP_04
MEHRGALQTWRLLLICSSLFQATASPPSKGAARDSFLFSNPTYVHWPEVEHSLNSVAVSDSSSLPQPLHEMSNDNSVHAKHFLPPNTSKSPRHLRRSLRDTGFDFSGDDEDVDSEDDFNFETTEEDVFESEQFILEKTSAPLVPSARTSDNADYSLLRPFEGTPDYQAVQTHQSFRNSQHVKIVDASSFLQKPTAASPNDLPVFEVTTHHTVLEQTEFVQPADGRIIALGKTAQTSTPNHSETEQQHLLTSSFVLGKEEAVVEFEGQPEYISPASVAGPSLAQRDQSLTKNEPGESYMIPGPLQSVSPMITGTDYSPVTGGSSLRAGEPSVGVQGFLNVTDASEAGRQHNYQYTANIVENALNLSISSTTEYLEPGIERRIINQVNPSEKSFDTVDSATTTQWHRTPMNGASKSSAAHQMTHSYSTSGHGHDIDTQPADNMTTVVKVLQDAQSFDIPEADLDGSPTARDMLSTETVTIRPTAGLLHLTMKDGRKGLTSTESPRTDTSTYFFALTAQRRMLSVGVNPIHTATRNMRAEYTPSGSYMAMLQTKPTELPQRLTAKVSNKTHVPTTQQPEIGTKWTTTNLSLPRTTSRAPLPTSHPTKVFQTETSTVKGTATVKTTPPVTSKPGTHHNVMTTSVAGKSGNDRQSPTVMITANTSIGLNTSSKEQDSQHGSERKNSRPVDAQKPDHTSNSKPTIDNNSDENKSYSRLCSTWDRECISNKTSAQWNDLKQTLGFAWELHVYGAGILFVILMLMSLINLIGSPILYIPELSYLMAANAQLFALGLLRAIYLFLDPYGSRSKLPPVGSLVLYNITFPLLITIFGILTLMLLKMGQLQMLSSNIQSPAFLAVIAVIHFVVLLSGDLLYLLLNPAVNIILHIFSVSWGSFLIFAFFLSCRKLKSRSEATIGQNQQPTIHSEESVDLQNPERVLKQLSIFTRVLAIGGVFGLLCCALQVYAILWLYGILGEKGHFYWSWWFLQFWYRCFEIVISFAMCFVTSYAFCQHQGRPDHICWSKIVQYFNHYRKREAPGYPNNCYDWSSGTQDRITNNDICKNLIRNQSESMPLKALNEPKPNKSYCNKDGSLISLDHRPKIPVLGPKSHNLMMGRSFTSICIEKESVLSLNVFDLRPPSPINLSRSIDEALFREHIVRDSLFHTSRFHYPSDVSVEDSCSTLTTRKALDQGNVTLGPSETKRRNSDSDYLYSIAKCSSLNNVRTDTSQQTSQDLEHTQASSKLHRSASSSSLDSASKTSFGIHWYSWTRNHSSGESVPSADPASESLLPPSKNLDNSEVKLTTEDPDVEAHKSFLEIRVTDDVSLSSDTIEL